MNESMRDRGENRESLTGRWFDVLTEHVCSSPCRSIKRPCIEQDIGVSVR